MSTMNQGHLRFIVITLQTPGYFHPPSCHFATWRFAAVLPFFTNTCAKRLVCYAFLS